MQGDENNPKPDQNTKSAAADAAGLPSPERPETVGVRPAGPRVPFARWGALLALVFGGGLGFAVLPDTPFGSPTVSPFDSTPDARGGGLAWERTPALTFAAKAEGGRGSPRVLGAVSPKRPSAKSRGVILRRSADADEPSPGEPPGQFLFASDDGAVYTFRDDLTLADAHSRFGSGWTSFANARGALQSMPQRTLDPSVPLQWHNFSWPSLLLDRFPLSLDQTTPGLRMRRVDEFLFWMPRDFVPDAQTQGAATVACPAHQPSSLHVNRLWGYFDDDALLGGTVLLQDGQVDHHHADLVSRDTSTPGAALEPVAPLLSVHGTHVAGIMSARRNDFGVTGVAPGLEVEDFPLKESDGFAVELADVLAGLSRIEKRLARRTPGRAAPRTVLLSAVFEDDVQQLTTRGTPLRDALESLLKHDVAVVVPAGNGTPATRPSATLPSALAPFLEGRRGILVPVAASDLCSNRAWFSRIAPLASGTLLFAPGERIFSTLPNGDYGYLSGSSQAAAQVAAVLALGAHFAPEVTVRALVDTLVRTAQPLPAVATRAFMPDAWSFLVEIEQKK